MQSRNNQFCLNWLFKKTNKCKPQLLLTTGSRGNFEAAMGGVNCLRFIGGACWRKLGKPSAIRRCRSTDHWSSRPTGDLDLRRFRSPSDQPMPHFQRWFPAMVPCNGQARVPLRARTFLLPIAPASHRAGRSCAQCGGGTNVLKPHTSSDPTAIASNCCPGTGWN